MSAVIFFAISVCIAAFTAWIVSHKLVGLSHKTFIAGVLYLTMCEAVALLLMAVGHVAVSVTVLVSKYIFFHAIDCRRSVHAHVGGHGVAYRSNGSQCGRLGDKCYFYMDVSRLWGAGMAGGVFNSAAGSAADQYACEAESVESDLCDRACRIACLDYIRRDKYSERQLYLFVICI